jgi:hypothetical protein
MLPLLCLLYTLCLVSGRETATNYCAQISSSEANLAVGYFAMQIYAGKASYTYSIDISKFESTETCNLSNGMVNEYSIFPLNLDKRNDFTSKSIIFFQFSRRTTFTHHGTRQRTPLQVQKCAVLKSLRFTTTQIWPAAM